VKQQLQKLQKKLALYSNQTGTRFQRAWSTDTWIKLLCQKFLWDARTELGLRTLTSQTVFDNS